jgi:predicted  nucleic acid-binding Zn-ribbon protein
VSQQAEKMTDAIAAAFSDSDSTIGGSKSSIGDSKIDSKIDAKIAAKADQTLEGRLNSIIEERERIERDQEKLRGEAETELKRISPEIDSLQKEIEALRTKQQGIEGFLQRMAPKSAPLRRASFG